MRTIKQIFSKNLKILLIEKDIKAAELSKDTGIDSGIVSSWKNCKHTPSLENAIIISDYFKTSLDYLFGLSFERDYTPEKNINFYYTLVKILRYEEITFKKLTEECDISPSIFNNWRKGEIPRVESLINISKYLNLPIEYIIGRTDKTAL